MQTRERRLGNRVPLEMFLNEYVADRPHRCLSVNVSETGIYVHKLIQPIRRKSQVVGVEFELPGTNEVIWARGDVCYDTLDDYQDTLNVFTNFELADDLLDQLES